MQTSPILTDSPHSAPHHCEINSKTEVMQSTVSQRPPDKPRSHPSSADYGCWWPVSGSSHHHSEHTPDASLLSHWSKLPLLEHARWICSWLSSSANKKVYTILTICQGIPYKGCSWNSSFRQQKLRVLAVPCQTDFNTQNHHLHLKRWFRPYFT